MKNTAKTLKWTLVLLLIIKTLATVFMCFGHRIFYYLFPLGGTTIPFSVAYIFSKDKFYILIPLFAFIIIPLCHLAGFVLLLVCKTKPIIPAVFLAAPSLSDIFCMLLSISQTNELIYLAKTDELLAGKIISIAFNLLILTLLVLFTTKANKE